MECPVCHETIYNNHMFSTICGHVFHGHCIQSCLNRKLECPTCRKLINQTQIFQIYLEQEFFNCKIFESSINELKLMLNQQSADFKEASIRSQTEIETLRDEIRQLKESPPPSNQSRSDVKILLEQIRSKDFIIQNLQEQNIKLKESKAENVKQIEGIRRQLDELKFKAISSPEKPTETLRIGYCITQVERPDRH